VETIESLEQENFGLVAGQDLEKQNNPAGLPHGWYKVITASGKDAGFGFYCDNCKINVPDHAPESIRHCRKVDTLPGTIGQLRLPVHTIRPTGIAWI
jgi:hypothetical protein